MLHSAWQYPFERYSDVVILTGEVSSARAERAAGDDGRDSPGVSGVSNQRSIASRSPAEARQASGST